MASFFVSPTTDAEWAFDADTLAARIREQFPGADVRGPETPADAYQLHWTLQTSSGVPLEGALDRDGDGVTLDGDVVDCARFATWLQSIAPADAGLSFYDEGYTSAVALEPTTTIDELVTPFV